MNSALFILSDLAQNLVIILEAFYFIAAPAVHVCNFIKSEYCAFSSLINSST